MADIDAVVQQIAAEDGGVVSRQMLLRCGVAAEEIDDAVRLRYLRVIRRGWYDAGGSDPRVVAAVRAGGVVACVTALGRRQGVWAVPDAGVHIRRSIHYRRGAVDTGCRGYRPLAKALRAVDPIPEALACAARCAEAEQFVALCDSILRHRPGWTRSDIVPLLRGAPQRTVRLLDELDGRADSGVESLTRYRLRRAGIRVRTQVRVDGVGLVDMLAGERLIIECDGREHHLGAQFGRDRWRDLVGVSEGYLVMRLTYRAVLYQWDEVYPFIAAVIRRRDHRDRSAKVRSAG
ncbi:endonuclease domain-containing protein [Tsukamurella sp. 1534]|uniref:endonuclease domain-containing protein n=1 Tax=Tsukamurella sp. 1534 TaxID=1151061 RepID=UPI0002FC091A|nr:DUF559 domain-containing protein [Tsukamurella sp. 1534]